MDAKNREAAIQEMQMIEQNMQTIIMQKQAFNMELSETRSAREHIDKSSGSVFKIVGQLMLQSDAKSVKEDLSSKEKLIELRLKSLEKQEASLSERLEVLQKEFMKK